MCLVYGIPVVLWIEISFDYAGKQGILTRLLGLFESGVPIGVRVSETKLALLYARELLISVRAELILISSYYRVPASCWFSLALDVFARCIS